MDKGFTDITVVVDRSSSMAGQVHSTIEGFASFLAEQQQAEGRAVLTLIQFCTGVQVDYEGVEIQDAHPLTEETYRPGGMTALNDAVGTAVLRAKDRQSRMAESERPHKTIIVVITDGQENSSKEFRGASGLSNLQTLIERQQAEHGWQFLFLGQDLNAQSVAQQYNVASARGLSFRGSTQGVRHAYVAATNAISDSRKRLGGLISSNLEGGSLSDQLLRARIRGVGTEYRPEDLAMNDAILNDSGTSDSTETSSS